MPNPNYVFTKNMRLFLMISLLTAAFYIWAFGVKQYNIHLDFLAERLAQKQPAPSHTANAPDQPSQIVAPDQMPSGLYPAFLQAQQTEPSSPYAITNTPNGLEANNPAHSFNSHFTAQGVAFPGWQLQLAGIGWEGQELAPTSPVTPIAQGQRIEYHHMAGLTEWYLNGPLGLEQGFTLAQPLIDQPQNSWLTLELGLQGATATPTGQDDWLVLNPATGPALRYGKLYAYDADGASLPIKLEVNPGGKGLRLLADVHAARFPVTIDPFVQQQMLTASDGVGGDDFGYSVALNSAGDIAFIGAVGRNNFQGAVYVFTRVGTVWSQQQILSVVCSPITRPPKVVAK